MIYLFLVLAAMAIAVYQLGALTVWTGVLSGALVALAVIVATIVVAGAVYTIWKRIRSRTPRLKELPKL